MTVDYAELRRELVERLEWLGVIRTEKVKKAFLKVPRELFVLPSYRREAYEDTPLPILEGQTISAPHMCAIMCEALDLNPGDKLLEIGTGSGYHIALCAEIIQGDKDASNGILVTVEIYPKLAKFAKENLEKAGYGALVNIVVADGSLGAPTRISFDKILVTAAAPEMPPSLIEQLNPGGRLIIPVGRFYQDLKLVIKGAGGEIHVKSLGGCVFVPLKGEYGVK